MEKFAGLVALAGLEETAGDLVAGGVTQAGLVLEEAEGVGQRGVEDFVVAGAVLHEAEQGPAEGRVLVLADVLQGAFAFGLELAGAGLGDALVLPTLVEGVR